MRSPVRIGNVTAVRPRRRLLGHVWRILAGLRGPAALPARAWAVLAGGWALTVWIAIATRVQWGPDTPFYLAWTYRLLGYDDAEAVRRSVGFLAHEQGVTCADSTLPWCKAENFPMYFAGDFAATVGPRVGLPLLSAPGVALFGPRAMVGLSIVAYTVAILCVVLLAARLFGSRLALLGGLLMSAAWLVSNWGVHANTEALALMFTTATLLPLPLRRVARRRDLVLFVLLLEASLFTRQFALTLVAGTVLAWLWCVVRDRHLNNPWSPFALAAVLCGGLTVYVQGLMTSGYASDFSALGTYQRNTGTEGLTEGLLAVPGTAAHILAGDWRHVRADVVLSAVLLLAAVSIAWRRRSELSALALGAFVGTLGLNLITNSDSIFRYHAPVFSIYLLAALALLADLVGRRRPAYSTDAPPGPTREHPERAGAPAGPRLAGVPVAGWAALLGGYLLLVTVSGQTNFTRAGTGSGPARGGDNLPHLADLAPILAYGLAIAVVVALAGRRWGTWGLLAGVAMLAPTVLVTLGRELATPAEPVAALAVACGLWFLPLHRRPTASPWLAGWGFGAATLWAAVLDPYAAVLAGGVLLAYAVRAARHGWRNEWLPPLVTGAAASTIALFAGSLLAGVYPAERAPLRLTVTDVGIDLIVVFLAVWVVTGAYPLWRLDPAAAVGVGALLLGGGLMAWQWFAGEYAGVRPVAAALPVLGLAAAAIAVHTWPPAHRPATRPAGEAPAAPRGIAQPTTA